MLGREHGPTVACALGDVEGFAGAEHGDDGQVVDGALGAVGEAETWRVATFVVVEVAVLHSDELTVCGEVGYFEPRRALSVGP